MRGFQAIFQTGSGVGDQGPGMLLEVTELEKMKGRQKCNPDCIMMPDALTRQWPLSDVDANTRCLQDELAKRQLQCEGNRSIGSRHNATTEQVSQRAMSCQLSDQTTVAWKPEIRTHRKTSGMTDQMWKTFQPGVKKSFCEL